MPGYAATMVAFPACCTRGIRMLATTIVLALGGTCLAAEDAPVRFVAIGDTPYKGEVEAVEDDVIPAIVESGVPFVVHYGDIKDGREPCTDAVLLSHRDRIRNLHDGPVFYTPGDNEWTDCDRRFLSTRFSELERLSRLRELFFRDPVDVPEDWHYSRQPNFPENARWFLGGVQFVTIHAVGTNNGRSEVLLDDVEAAISLVEARDHANRVWLSEGFAQARRRKAGALVIITQADVTAPFAGGPCTPNLRSDCDAFLALREQLIVDARRFHDWGAPRKPVLLVHGDTDPYCWDKRFGGERAPNLWRLNAWGDFRNPVDATEISVRPADPVAPFSARTLLWELEPQESCD